MNIARIAELEGFIAQAQTDMEVLDAEVEGYREKGAECRMQAEKFGEWLAGMADYLDGKAEAIEDKVNFLEDEINVYEDEIKKLKAEG